MRFCWLPNTIIAICYGDTGHIVLMHDSRVNTSRLHSFVSSQMKRPNTLCAHKTIDHPKKNRYILPRRYTIAVWKTRKRRPIWSNSVSFLKKISSWSNTELSKFIRIIIARCKRTIATILVYAHTCNRYNVSLNSHSDMWITIPWSELMTIWIRVVYIFHASLSCNVFFLVHEWAATVSYCCGKWRSENCQPITLHG